MSLRKIPVQKARRGDSVICAHGGKWWVVYVNRLNPETILTFRPACETAKKIADRQHIKLVAVPRDTEILVRRNSR